MAISERIKRKPKESPAIPDFGAAGAPIDRGHPFYFGFVATVGALTAFVLMRALASASQVFVLILILEQQVRPSIADIPSILVLLQLWALSQHSF